MLFVKPEVYDIAKELSESLETISLLPIPFWFQVLHAYIGSVVMLIAGVFILKGNNWARVVLMVWMLSVLFITFLVAGFVFQLYTKSIFTVIFALLLYSKKSNSYFSREGG